MERPSFGCYLLCLADPAALCCVLCCCCVRADPSVEEQTLQDKMQADHHDADFDMDAASHRLNEIYERMNEVRGREG